MLRKNIILLLALFSASAVPGVEIGGSRLIYNAGSRQAELSVSNPDEKPYLIQSWVENQNMVDDDDTTFITTPPLFRLEAHSQNSVRIVYTGTPLPDDRESLFWLNIKSIPSMTKSDGNQLSIAVKSRLKVFYRPGNLKGDVEDAWKNIKFIARPDGLYVKNPSPYFISLYEMQTGDGNKNIPLTLDPFSEKFISRHAKIKSTITWRAINDFGGVSSVMKQNL